MDLMKLKMLLNSDKYIVPVYQREFAWSQEELIRLVKDIEDSRRCGKEEYYMGSLVTFHLEDHYELVDGQQRLTALALLFTLSNDDRRINLSYEARPASVESLESLQRGEGKSGHIFYRSREILSSEVEKVDREAFFEYLREHVYILRTELSSSTDLNHYFKIMNSRYPQCTKGDVVFSILLSKLENPKEREIAKVIWRGLDSFSGFLAGCIPERLYNRMIYGDGVAPLLDSSYKSWWKMITSHTEGDDDNITCSLDDALVFDSEEYIRPMMRSEKGGCFYSILTFEEFLMYGASLILELENDFDDKKILEVYSHISSFNSEEVKSFLYDLLILRYLFDTYIIKRNGDDWCLLKYKDINEYVLAFDEMNKKLVNLESLYASAIDTKLWLKPILIFLRKNVHSSGEELLKALESYSFDSQLYLLYKEKYYDNNLSSKSYKIVKNGSLFDIFNDN